MSRHRIDGWVSPMWLSHNYPDEYHRCIRVGNLHVCRRCAVIYPLAAVVLALSAVGPGYPGWLTAAASIVLPFPTVLEWILEHRAIIPYSPRRQILASIPLGIATGFGTTRYFVDHLDPLALIVVAIYGTTCTVFAFFLDAREDGTGIDLLAAREPEASPDAAPVTTPEGTPDSLR